MTEWPTLHANGGWISMWWSKSTFFPTISVLPAQTTQRWRMKLKREGGTGGSDWAPSEHKDIGNGDVKQRWNDSQDSFQLWGPSKQYLL